MKQDNRTIVWRPHDHPYIEVIDGSPLTGYHSVLHLHEEFDFAWKPASWRLLVGETTHTISADVVVVTSPCLPHKAIVAEGDHSRYVGFRIAPQFVYDIVENGFTHTSNTPSTLPITFIQNAHFRTRLRRLHSVLLSSTLRVKRQKRAGR